MKLLVIGSGGREHAIAWQLAKSPKVATVYVASGNAGTANETKLENIAITDVDDLVLFAKNNQIAFTVVGPEAFLALGIVDQFRANGLKIWGPTQYCTMLESSKSFAKEFMIKNHIPTAKHTTFTNEESAHAFLAYQEMPIVIKADGLAAGKGVLVANTLSDANNFITEIFSQNKFGSAGNKVVIEEFLDGIEASFIVMIDGKNILPLASSQDHKRLLDDDLGPNTGGMGAYSPAPIITPKLHNRIIKEIIQPVIDGMKHNGHTYTGFLYAGVMIDKEGNPLTLEFNCRMGDPETQAIMMRLNCYLADLIELGLTQKLDTAQINWKDECAIGVVLATSGYPNNPITMDTITGLDHIKNDNNPNIKVFHASTINKDHKIFTSGGRVLCVVGCDQNFQKAREITYHAIDKIKFEHMVFRHDIGNNYFKQLPE